MEAKRFLKNKIIFGAIIFATGVFFSGWGGAIAATLQLNSSSAALSVGDTATLNVVLNSEGVAVNNVEATITFPTDLLDVIAVNKSSSVFSLWVEEPYFSNSTGVITFNGGVPTPGFNGSRGPVVSIVVKAKKAGQANLSFSTAAVRANDGLGTDVLSSKSGKIISIGQKEILKEVPKVEPVTAVPTTLPAPSLKISSPSHPNQDQWYKSTNSSFQWVLPNGVEAIQTALDNNNSGSPRVTYSPAISEKTVKDLKDGVWYFKARARRGGTWGPTSTYIVRVDATAPQIKNAIFSYDSSTKMLNLNVSAQDETSGVDYYNLFINDVLVKKITSAEFIDGNYNLSFDTPGENTVKLIVIDRAGNNAESVGAFSVPALGLVPSEIIATTTSVAGPLLITVGSFSAPALYMFTFVLLIIVALVLAAFYLGRSFRRELKLNFHSVLVKSDSLKTLSLLRRRLEKHLEILQHVRHDRILTKEEKKIKEALESDLDELDRAIEIQKTKK